MAWIILGAVFIGLTLGMLGSGGSIVAVPVLRYLVGEPEKLAIASSLAIVGAIALVGSGRYIWKHEVDWRSVVWFGLPGMLGAMLGAIAAQGLPEGAQLLIFSGVMLIASRRMLATGRDYGAQPQSSIPGHRSKTWLAAIGLLVGAITGIVGVGGGFMIVPALVLLVGLTMRRAVGTSLVVISLNAFTGFAKYVAALKALHLALDWRVIGMFVALGAIGTVAGHWCGSCLPQQRLKQMFGILIIGVSIYIIVHELPALAK
jgi:uncharacterized membrane protein YfcA